MGSKRICIALITIILCGVAATTKPNEAKAARGMLVGIYDPVQPLPRRTPRSRRWSACARRSSGLNLDWNLIATQAAGRSRPIRPTRPTTGRPTTAPCVNAAKNKIQVLFTIYGTPRWAQTGKKGVNRAPSKMKDLRYFALAAAKRYSGSFKREDGTKLPPVRKWLAWNEPNNPVFLQPQWQKVGAAGQEARCVARCARRGKLRRHLHGGLHRRPLLAPSQGGRRLRRHRPARQQRAAEQPAVDLADRVPERPAQVRAEAPQLRRLRAPPVLRPPGASRRRTKPKGKQTVTLANISVLTKLLSKLVRQQEALDHRVRLPDEPARQVVRRHLGQAGQVPDAGLRDRPQEPAGSR